jgi:hypothetical protein
MQNNKDLAGAWNATSFQDHAGRSEASMHFALTTVIPQFPHQQKLSTASKSLFPAILLKTIEI